MVIPKRVRLPDHDAVPGRKLWKCLKDDCDKQADSRGLCRSHALYASRLVKEGVVTWEDLEKRGKCLPKGYVRQFNSRAWFLAEKKKVEEQHDGKVGEDEVESGETGGPPVMKEEEK